MCSNTCTKINCQARIPSALQSLTSPSHPKLSQVTTSTEMPLTCQAFSLTQEKGGDNLFVEQWKCLCLPVTSVRIHGASVFQSLQTKAENLDVCERYVKENGGSRVECCETLSVLLVTLACHCPLNVTSSRAQLQGSKKHSFLLYQNTQLPGTLKD